MKTIIYWTLLISGIAQGRELNVLSWWGYFDEQVLAEVQGHCQVKLSVDEYYSNGEFLRRHQKAQYDLFIFSYTIYQLLQKKFSAQGPSLAPAYHPVIRKKYQEEQFPSGVRFFQHAVTGFLYNPKRLTREQLLKGVAGEQTLPPGLVVVIDDPFEMAKMLRVSDPQKLEENFLARFAPTRGGQVFISNEFQNIANKEDFNFAFTWSGEVFHGAHEKNLLFLVDPAFSTITADLITLQGEDPAARCAYEFLSSAPFLNRLSARSGYLSPYPLPEGRAPRESLQGKLKNLPWVESVAGPSFQEYLQTWNGIKLKLSDTPR